MSRLLLLGIVLVLVALAWGIGHVESRNGPKGGGGSTSHRAVILWGR